MFFPFDDLESFHGSDGGSEHMSEEAYERFQEQMRTAAGQIKALQKAQQTKKKKEDALVKIIEKFLQKKGKSDLVFLAAQVLAEDIPALFVLSVLILADPEIRDDLMKHQEEKDGDTEKIAIPPGENALITVNELDFSNRQDIDSWVNGMAEYAGKEPLKFLKNIKNPEKKIKYVVVEFLVRVAQDYCAEKSIETTRENIEQFCIFALKRIVEYVHLNAEQLEHEKDRDMGWAG